MKENDTIRYHMSLLCFLLCSSVLYNPLYSASRPVFCCILTIISGLIISVLYHNIFKRQLPIKANSFPQKAVCSAAFLSLCMGCVFFISILTENFSTFSSFYDSKEKHLAFAIILLFICAYGAHKNSGGIFRFCQLLLPAMLLYYVILFLSPITTKTVVFPQKYAFSPLSPDGLFQALKGILYFFSDIAAFHFAFDKHNRKSKLATKKHVLPVFIFSLILIINRIRASFTFGETLVQNMSLCDLAAIKLLPVISFPEIYLLFISLACSVKISVYLRAASKLLGMLPSKTSSEGFRYDTYICAFLCLVLSTVTTRLLSSFSAQSSLFIMFLPISGFFITLLCLLPTKRQK